MLKHTEEAMRGRWFAFFTDTCPEMAVALRALPSHCACPLPGHVHSIDGFRLFGDFFDTGGGVCNTCGSKKDGVKLYAALREISLKKAEQAVWAWLAVKPEDSVVKTCSPPVDAAAALAAKAQAIARTLAGSLPVVDQSVVHRYLLSRGLTLSAGVPEGLLYHPMMDYWGIDKNKRVEKQGRFPVMVAPLLSPKGEAVSVHRTYLALTGEKAPVTTVKKLMPAAGSLDGAAIRLITRIDSDELHIAEGIETALAAADIAETGSFWAAATAGGVERFIPPEWVRHVHIWADFDPSVKASSGKEIGFVGTRAAQKLAIRLRKQGYIVEIHVPPIKVDTVAVDWLDILNSYPLARLRRSYLKRDINKTLWNCSSETGLAKVA
jgi:hypothetical protein